MQIKHSHYWIASAVEISTYEDATPQQDLSILSRQACLNPLLAISRLSCNTDSAFLFMYGSFHALQTGFAKEQDNRRCAGPFAALASVPNANSRKYFACRSTLFDSSDSLSMQLWLHVFLWRWPNSIDLLLCYFFNPLSLWLNPLLP